MALTFSTRFEYSWAAPRQFQRGIAYSVILGTSWKSKNLLVDLRAGKQKPILKLATSLAFGTFRLVPHEIRVVFNFNQRRAVRSLSFYVTVAAMALPPIRLLLQSLANSLSLPTVPNPPTHTDLPDADESEIDRWTMFLPYLPLTCSNAALSFFLSLLDVMGRMPESNRVTFTRTEIFLPPQGFYEPMAGAPPFAFEL